MNALVAILLLLGSLSIVVYKIVDGRRPVQPLGATEPASHRTTLSIWPTLGAILGALIGGSLLYHDITTSGVQAPVDGRVLILALVVVAGAVGLWGFRIYQTMTRR